MISAVNALLLACAASIPAAPAVAQASSEVSGTLAAALESVRASNLSADLHFVASDEMGGRDTPSSGLRQTARFIRSRLMRLGWQPGAPDGFFYVYKLSKPQIDESETRASVVKDGAAVLDLVLGRDYFFSTRGLTSAEFSGPVVFCGFGGDEDFEGLDLAGKWALCFDGKGSSRSRANRAEEAGALGVIQTPGPDYVGKPYAERFDSYVESMRRSRVSWPKRSGADEVFPFVYLAGAAGAKMLAQASGPSGEPWTPAVGESLGLTFTDRRREVGEGGLIDVENVCGFFPGTDPELSKEVILLSGHYDHVGTSSRGIYNGADDNGSGTCGLLAVAEALTVRGPLPRSVMIIWVSGEEKGLWGSLAWTLDPWLPEGCRPVLDINIDMIGRNAPDQLLVTPTKARAKDYNGLTRLVENLGPLEGFTDIGSADEYWNRSDHANFRQNLDIPVAFLFTDVHEDYHQPTDTPDKIDYDKMRRVVRLVVRMIDGLQDPILDL